MKYYIEDPNDKGNWKVGYKDENGNFKMESRHHFLDDAVKVCNRLNGNEISRRSVPTKPQTIEAKSEITLRDYFAAMAMQVLIKDFGIESTAVKAYSYADAIFIEIETDGKTYANFWHLNIKNERKNLLCKITIQTDEPKI